MFIIPHVGGTLALKGFLSGSGLVGVWWMITGLAFELVLISDCSLVGNRPVGFSRMRAARRL